MSDNHTTVLGAVPGTSPRPAAPSPAPTPSLARPRIPASPSAAVWAGLAVVAFGFGTILFSWIKVAATLDVGRQMPYVVSGAITGVGLIVVGIALVDMAVRRQDRQERRQQLAVMSTLLVELRAAVDPTTDLPQDRS
ncbi:MAG: hypothetical protein F2667_14440 [Actinobacteria bacterium]|uniref:Unannotated protein n=1 Tax=freshwater metagenome TaxID=449393 RepID=A0A6J6SGV7_9ZZZZ|nr:hypothetical protein [Actinomycetota bacterium]